MQEVWKDIEGYEGIYQVSNLGNVRSLEKKVYNRTNKGKNLKMFDNGHGYLQVILQKNKNKKSFKVHRLVANAFLDNPNNLPQVNHKDCNRKNNNVDNLEFCSCDYNIKYASENSLEYQKRRKIVKQFDLNGNFIKLWNSVSEASQVLNIARQNISACCLSKNYKSAGGYIWKYESEVC